MKKYFIFGSIIFALILIVNIFERCSRSKIVITDNNPTILVTPIVDTKQIQELDIKLPNYEKAEIVIPVPTPIPVLGKKVTPHVVVSDKGNTYIAYTEKLAIGFRFDPKITMGYSNNIFIGIGTTFFKIWRLETDFLLFYNIDNDIRLGIGESYQLTQNTSIGIVFSENINLQSSIGIYLALKF